MHKDPNAEKTAAVFDFSSLNADSSGKKIITLLDILIAEVRRENDTVEDKFLLKNQGRIMAYAQLKDYLERGLPNFNLTKA
jgi:hypothetical protein